MSKEERERLHRKAIKEGRRGSVSLDNPNATIHFSRQLEKHMEEANMMYWERMQYKVLLPNSPHWCGCFCAVLHTIHFFF
jgi:hypothetical protein